MNSFHRAFVLVAYLLFMDGIHVSGVFAQNLNATDPNLAYQSEVRERSTFSASRGENAEEVISQLEEENRFAPPSAGDRDLGEQLILKYAPKQRRFRVLADAYLFWADNVGNTAKDEESDVYLGSQLQAGWQPRLGGRWFADMEISQAIYRYDTFDQLDFEVFEARTHLAYVLTQLENVILFGGPNVVHMTNNSFQDKLLSSVSIVGGAQKIFLLDRRNSIHVIAMVDRDLSTDQDRVFRNEYIGEISWRYKLMRDLVITPSIRYTYYDYTRVSRNDEMSIVGASLSWMPRRWLELYLSGTYAANDSTLDEFDFESRSVGAGLGVKLRF